MLRSMYAERRITAVFELRTVRTAYVINISDEQYRTVTAGLFMQNITHALRLNSASVT
jgi:hypothetical protein